MRRGGSSLLQWGAVVALALLAFAAAPHFHDEADGRDDTCVLCHVQGSPALACNVHESPDPAVGGAAPACEQRRVRTVDREGHASRAPPA